MKKINENFTLFGWIYFFQQKKKKKIIQDFKWRVNCLLSSYRKQTIISTHLIQRLKFHFEFTLIYLNISSTQTNIVRKFLPQNTLNKYKFVVKRVFCMTVNLTDACLYFILVEFKINLKMNMSNDCWTKETISDHITEMYILAAYLLSKSLRFIDKLILFC